MGIMTNSDVRDAIYQASNAFSGPINNVGPSGSSAQQQVLEDLLGAVQGAVNNAISKLPI
jgi:hypothetical protein